MEGEPDMYILRPGFGSFLRRGRVFVIAPAVLCVIAIGFGIAAAATSPNPRFAHQMGAVGLLFVIYVGAACIVLPRFARRTGFYAKRGDVGTLRPDGSPRRPEHPVTHFVRITAVNKLGIGALRSMPIIYGMNDSGQRVIALSGLMNEPRDIDAFIEASGLPVQGRASDRIGIAAVVKRFPMAPEMHSQVWQGLLVAVPFVLFMVAGVLIIIFAVH
jgi:hypothetical protein